MPCRWGTIASNVAVQTDCSRASMPAATPAASASQAAEVRIELCACRSVSSLRVASGFAARQPCCAALCVAILWPSCQLCRQADGQADKTKQSACWPQDQAACSQVTMFRSQATYSLAVPQELCVCITGMTDEGAPFHKKSWLACERATILVASWLISTRSSMGTPSAAFIMVCMQVSWCSAARS